MHVQNLHLFTKCVQDNIPLLLFEFRQTLLLQPYLQVLMPFCKELTYLLTSILR